MAFEISVDISGALSALDKLSPAQVDQRSHAAMAESLAFLQAEVRAGMPVDQGIARGSVYTAHRGVSLGAVGSPLAYVQVLEEGRRPGATPPPSGPIRAWLERHGMDGRLAFVVARAIGRRGLPAHHMFGRAAEKGKGVIEAIFLRHFHV